ncbi:MAG: amidohydrolase family protein, partial [Limisphaerales bacterium]
HARFPYQTLKEAGVYICLGTDSLASSLGQNGAEPELNMFLEMQRFACDHPEVSPEEILLMATCNGARMLNINVGQLSPERRADFIAIPFPGEKREAASAILQHTGSVRKSWIAGKEVFSS